MAVGARSARKPAWWIAPPIAFGVFLIAIAIFNPAKPELGDGAEAARTVRIVEALAAPITPRVVGYGAVEPARSWSVVPEVAGRVVYVSPDFVRGGVVTAGETVIRIDDADYKLAADQARADIVSAEAQIDELAQSKDNTESTLALERQTLAVAERELKRQQDLVARGAGAPAAVDTAETAALGLRASVLQLENSLKLIPAQIQALESARAVAEAALAAALLDLERVEIAAPFDGRVATTDVEVSQYVGVGAQLGVVDGVASAEIDAQFAAASIRDFIRLASHGRTARADAPAEGSGVERLERTPARIGLQAVASLEIGADGLGRSVAAPSWSADVLRISEQIDPETRAIGVIVAVDDPYGRARPGARPALIKGAFLRVELYAPPVEGLVLAPRSALSPTADGGAEIHIVGEEDRLERRSVEVLAVIGDVAAISSGLAPGARVVVTDLAPAIVGERMRAVPDAVAAARLAAAAAPPERPAE